VVLRDYWLDRGIEPEPEFERLKQEVEHDIRRETIEELTSEHGNFDKRPWGVHVLTDVPTFVSRGPGDAGQHAPPDYTTPDGIGLWIADYGIHGSGKNSQRLFAIDAAPEWAQSELEAEFGDDAEFVTVYDDGDTEYLADSGGKEPSVWQRVREFNMGERECPFRTWDPEAREDHQGRKPRTVTVTDTYYGEHPGELCRLCEERIGEEHGYLYLGEEPNEVVYLRLVAALPLSEREDDNAEREITAAFVNFADARGLEHTETFFEHEHWWTRAVDREETEHTFNVVDVGDGGIDFEEV
jgi:hypothetical protein